MNCLRLITLIVVYVAADFVTAAAENPTTTGAGFSVQLFAESPLVVTPTGIAVDSIGRVFVAESHTHFRPENYDGPPTDRILILSDTDHDGIADQSQVFHEGFTHIMDIEFDSAGRLYVATRMDIHRMEDSNADGRADGVIRIINMETAGTYPHNGISGLCFLPDGSLNFGLGENLGHAYTLVGSDGTQLSGGGEGGTTYRCQADGSELVRTSTGWWNPFGMCADRYGRVFGTDNDPGASPPCRLIQLHEGADYGYEYRYGRSGLHPLTTWTGDLPGTIPMIAGTGEAPCAIVPVPAAGFPNSMHGDLLVACWADHRIERFHIRQSENSAQVTATRSEFVTGDNDFRPVGLAFAPNGDLYVSDWVLADYQLHGKGRVWKISPGQRSNAAREATPPDPLAVRVRSVRKQLNGDPSAATRYAASEQPAAIRAEAVRHLKLETDAELLLAAAAASDPVVQHAAIESLSRQVDHPTFLRAMNSPTAPVLLALKRSLRRTETGESELLARVLATGNAASRQVAIKWIADDKLKQHAEAITNRLAAADLSAQEYLMLAAAQDRLAGREPSDIPAEDQLVRTLLDPRNSPTLRGLALRLLPEKSLALSLRQLADLASTEAAEIRLEAIRQLAGMTDPGAVELLSSIADDQSRQAQERLEAIDALGSSPGPARETLLRGATSASGPFAEAALRSLTTAALSEAEKDTLRKLSDRRGDLSALIDRVLKQPEDRPAAGDLDAWMRLTVGAGDAAEGERLFFHPSVGGCSRCHQYEGRGQSVGPSLSLMHRRLPEDREAARRSLLQTILQPSAEMAPQYTPWIIVTVDGRRFTGLPRRKGGSQEAYLGVDGREFIVKKKDIEAHYESRTSIMPEGLLQTMTVREMRDLLAFLTQETPVESVSGR